MTLPPRTSSLQKDNLIVAKWPSFYVRVKSIMVRCVRLPRIVHLEETGVNCQATLSGTCSKFSFSGVIGNLQYNINMK